MHHGEDDLLWVFVYLRFPSQPDLLITDTHIFSVPQILRENTHVYSCSESLPNLSNPNFNLDSIEYFNSINKSGIFRENGDWPGADPGFLHRGKKQARFCRHRVVELRWQGKFGPQNWGSGGTGHQVPPRSAPAETSPFSGSLRPLVWISRNVSRLPCTH